MKSMRILATAALATAVLATAAAPAVGDPSHPGGTFFDDDGDVHEGAIEAIGVEGVTRGCNPPQNTNYCPLEEVTRGEMAAFLVRALRLSATSGDTFSDDDASVFEADIQALAAEGITRGCNPPDNDRYCPDDAVTRGQMAAFLVRAFGYTQGAGSDLFEDDDRSVFESDIDRLGMEGVTRGCNPPANTLFCPDDPVLRDQMASFLSRALQLPAVTPPSRTATAEGTFVNLLELATDQGCDAATEASDGRTDDCVVETVIAAGEQFFVDNGWGKEGWSTLSSDERNRFTSDSVRTDLYLNGLRLDVFERFEVEDDTAVKTSLFQFPGSLTPTTHVLVGEWVDGDVVDLRITLELTVQP